MRNLLTLTAATAASILSFAGEAHADNNERMEGVYSAECETITLSAGILDTECDASEEGAECSIEWRGKPFNYPLTQCGVGEIAPRTEEEVYKDCRDRSDLVVIVNGEEVPGVEHRVCSLAAKAYVGLATAIENAVNGTFTISGTGSTWVSAMTGRFDSFAGTHMQFPYATVHFPWQKGFHFATGMMVPFRFNTSVCDAAFATFTPMSGGNVLPPEDDESGEPFALELTYNLNGQMTCKVDDHSAWTAMVNFNTALSGEKLD